MLVHTGQHYDDELSRVFFDELGLPRPSTGSSSAAAPTRRRPRACWRRSSRCWPSERPTLVLVYGDTNSTLAGALAAAQARHPGRPRRGRDALVRPRDAGGAQPRADRPRLRPAAVLVRGARPRTCAPSAWPGEVEVVGDVMVDVALLLGPRAARAHRGARRPRRGSRAGSCSPPPTAPATSTTRRGSSGSSRCSRRCRCRSCFPLHPRTRARLEAAGPARALGVAALRCAAARLPRVHRAAAARARGADRLRRRPEGGLPGRRAVHDAARHHRVGRDGRGGLERAGRPRRRRRARRAGAPAARASARRSTATGARASASSRRCLGCGGVTTSDRVGVVGPRLLGPEPGPQLRRAPGLRAAPGAATPPRRRASARRAAFPSARFTGRPRRAAGRPRARRRRARHAGADPRRARRARAARPASTASSRSRSRSRSPTPSARSPRPTRAGRMLMVGHLLEYHPGVAKLKEIADSGELGDIHYIYSQPPEPRQAARRRERAVVARRARRLGRAAPGRRGARTRSSARGESYMQPGVEDVVFCFLRFPSGLAAHLHLSWLDPHKERRFTVVGSQADGDVRRHGPRAQGHRLRQGLRRGRRAPTASTSPARATSGARAIPNREPLRIECEHFVECVRDGPDAALRRRQRAARRARARGRCRRALDASRAGAACSRLTARPGWSSARRASSPTTCVLGAHVVIHAGTVIGDGLRDPGRRGARQAAEARRATRRAPREAPPPLVLGDGAVVCAGAIVFAGATLGDGRDRRRPGVRARARA